MSGRTDIIAWYSKWFQNRYKEGFFDVRNPFNPKLVSRIYRKDVDAIVFCTKNPLPILPFLKEIKEPIVFQITITPYGKEIEPNVPSKKETIKAIKEISKIIGSENVFIRYDPIFFSEKYNISYHLKAFQKLCEALNGMTKSIIISFLDEYKNVKKNYKYLKYREITQEDYQIIGQNFSEIAKNNKMTVQTCFEKEDLTTYGFRKSACISKEYALKITGKTFKKWKSRNCNCVELVDIGSYNTCNHLCKYCYANYEENWISKNIKDHHPDSTLLTGYLKEDDKIIVRNK